MNAEAKLERFAFQEINAIKDNLVVSDGNGSYMLFGKYLVYPVKFGFEVVYSAMGPLFFSTKRCAFSWCVADNKKAYVLSRNIEKLDQKKRYLQADIQFRKELAAKSNDQEFKDTVNIKLENKVRSLKSVDAELQKCINLAKYWQTRGFSNEIK